MSDEVEMTIEQAMEHWFAARLSANLDRIEKEDLPKARVNFETWRNDASATNFSSWLFRLIGKADAQNRDRLRIAYPAEVKLYEEWERCHTPVTP